MLVGRELFQLGIGISWDIQQMSFHKGELHFPKVPKIQMFPHSTCTSHTEDMEDTPGDGVSILLLSDELTPTCSGWKQQGHGLVVSVFDSEFLFGNFEYPVINIADKETFGVYFHFEDIAMFVTEWIDE